VSACVGLEVLLADQYAPLVGRRIGLFTNPSAVDSRLESACRLLTGTPRLNIVALFSAEHGFSGAVDAGVSVDLRTGLPLHSRVIASK